MNLYEYEPKNYPFIEDELICYYLHLEKYMSDKTDKSRDKAEDKLRDLFFMLKANEACGNLSNAQFYDIKEYCEGLLEND